MRHLDDAEEYGYLTVVVPWVSRMLRALKGGVWEGCEEVREAVERLGQIRRRVRMGEWEGSNASFVVFECEAAMSRYPHQWSEGVGPPLPRPGSRPPMYPNNQSLDSTPQHLPLRFLATEFPELARLHAKVQALLRGQRRPSQVKKKVRPLAVQAPDALACGGGGAPPSPAPPTPVNDLRRSPSISIDVDSIDFGLSRISR